MSTFLAVLRITGIVLLCILAFVLLLLLLLIFVPYRYRIDAKKREEIWGRARIHWLLHFVIADLIYEDGINLRIRLAGIPIYDKKKKDAKAALKEDKTLTANKANRKKAEESAENSKEEDSAAATDAKEENSSSSESSAEENNGEEISESSSLSDKSSNKAPKKEPLSDKIYRFLECLEDSIWELSEKPQEFSDKAFEKAEELTDKYWFYRSLFDSEGTEWVIKYVKKRVKGLLKAIKPTRMDTQLEMTDEDPGRVAQVYQFYALALPLLDRIKGNTNVEAWQDAASLSGDVRLKGRIRLNGVIWHGGLLFINKKVKKFLTLLREGKA